MKTLLKNKKVILSLAIVFIIAVSGATYAWFTSRAATEASVGMGSLRVTARTFEEYREDATDDIIRVYPKDTGYVAPSLLDFTPLASWFEDGTYYEPGQEGIFAFEVANPYESTALNLIVKMSGFDGQIELWSDDDGNKLDVPDVYANIDALLADYPGAIIREVFDEYTAPGAYMFVDGAGEYVGAISWFYDETVFNATGEYEYYVMMTPSMSVDYSAQIAFVGDVMGNRFQRAVFALDSAFEATQTLEDAIQAKWPGVFLVEAGDFEIVVINGQGGTVSPASASVSSRFTSLTREQAMRFAFPEWYN